MSVEIFSRSDFEKALSFAPLSAKFVGAKSGQLEYLLPIATRLTCQCGQKFYPAQGYDSAQCPKCGQIENLSKSVIKPGEIFVKVYSSISPTTGLSRDTGEDSIRLVLVGHSGKPLGKCETYTTRVKGWERRLKNKIRDLWKLAQTLPRCPKCGHHVGWCKCKQGPNKGKQFARCWGCNVWIGWR